MEKRPRIRLLVAAGAVAATMAYAVPASAAAVGTNPAAGLSQLVMTKSGSVHRQVTLECDPAGGTHPTPDAACASIAAVNGQFGQLPSVPGGFCTADFAPVTVTVTGNWQSQPVIFTKTYTNDCGASVGSNFVFRF